MEAFPFADEVSLILSKYWKTILPEKRANLDSLDTIKNIRNLVDSSFSATQEDASFLKSFITKPDDRMMIDEFGNRLKRLMYHDSQLAVKLEALVDDYRNSPGQSTNYNVNIEWGDSTVSGSTAQVKQDRKIQVDTIDLSKYIEP
jgi:hypothetical protein